MRCHRCSRANRPDATFCDACGSQLHGVLGYRQMTSAQMEAEQERLWFASQAKQRHTLDPLAYSVFVGRRAELEVLQTALEGACAGSGRLVMLAGEPGMRSRSSV
jgi:hypothetical protein